MCSTHPHDHSGGALAGLLPKLGWHRWGAVAAAEGSQSLSGAASRPSRIKTCNGLENFMDGACAACGTASGHVAYAQLGYQQKSKLAAQTRSLTNKESLNVE